MSNSNMLENQLKKVQDMCFTFDDCFLVDGFKRWVIEVFLNSSQDTILTIIEAVLNFEDIKNFAKHTHLNVEYMKMLENLILSVADVYSVYPMPKSFMDSIGINYLIAGTFLTLCYVHRPNRPLYTVIDPEAVKILHATSVDVESFKRCVENGKVN